MSWQEPDWEDEDVVLKPGTKDDTDGSPAWIIIVVVLGGFALLCAFLFYDYWQKAGNPLANRPVRKIGACTQHVANYLGFMCDFLHTENGGHACMRHVHSACSVPPEDIGCCRAFSGAKKQKRERLKQGMSQAGD